MKLSDREVKPIRCPFCDAPQLNVPENGTLEMKCEYCGGVFSIASMQIQDVPRCENHPDRMATGKCNDCEGSFCSRCLADYELKTRGESGVLSLCPTCLRNRYFDRANQEIYGSLLFLIFGIIAVFFSVSISIDAGLIPTILFLAMGTAIMIHGFYLRKSVAKMILPNQLSDDNPS